MKQNYIILIFIIALSFTTQAQTVLVDQQPNGSSGIVSDFINGTLTASAEDFTITDSYVIETIVAPGFSGDGIASLDGLATAIDVYIYTDAAGVPSSNPTVPGMALLSITNLALPNPAISIDDDPATTDVVESDITIDVTAANGSAFTLDAGTYWLVIAPHVTDDGDRWNWSQSDVGANAVIFDEGNFGAGFDWTPIVSLVPNISSVAMTISGTLSLSIDEFSIDSVKTYPNPTTDILHIDVPNIELTQVELFSILGKKVYTSTNDNAIDMSGYTSGIYLLKLSDGKGSVTKRIVKQ